MIQFKRLRDSLLTFTFTDIIFIRQQKEVTRGREITKKEMGWSDSFTPWRELFRFESH